jgi:hypothetical protein
MCIHKFVFIDVDSEDTLNQYALNLQKFVIIKYVTRTLFITKEIGPNCQESKVNTSIRTLYHYRNHRALQTILYGTKFCQIDKLKLEKHFAFLFSKKSKINISDLPSDLWKKPIIYESHNFKLTSNFKSVEIKKKLFLKIRSPFNNSKSVGLDSISYEHLYKLAHEFVYLQNLFNFCLKFEKIPKIWQQSYSVLIKKKEGNLNNIKSWDLLAIHNTTSQLFQNLLNHRLCTWGIDTGVISKSQLIHHSKNAIFEASFILQECKRYAKQNNKNLAIAWLNFSNASDWIPQEIILHSLIQFSVPVSIRNLIISLLNSSTKIRIQQGYTKYIPILKGLPQGFPINQGLMSLVIECILNNLINDDENVFQIFNRKINHFILDDELTLIAGSKEQLQNLLNSVEKNAKEIGFEFNVNDCVTFYYNGQNNQIQNAKFKFFSKILPSLKGKTIHEYFGVKQGLSIIQKGIPSVEELFQTLKSIDSSSLSNNQKMESFQIFLVPRFKNYLQGSQCMSDNEIKYIDKVVMNKIKLWLKIKSENVTTECIINKISKLNNMYCDQYLPFIDLLYILKIVHAYYMLTSNNEVINEIAFNALLLEFNNSIDNIPAEDKILNNLSKYLSGEIDIKKRKENTTWEMARKAILKLNAKIHLVWKFKEDKIQLMIKKKNQNYIINNITQTIMKELINYYKKNSSKIINNT